MSYTSWKKRIRRDTRIHVTNIRRPWRSRHMTVVSVSKRSFRAMDLDAFEEDTDVLLKEWNVHLPPAAFTRVIDDDTIEYLANADGPAWSSPGVPINEIMAGEPFLRVKILS